MSALLRRQLETKLTQRNGLPVFKPPENARTITHEQVRTAEEGTQAEFAAMCGVGVRFISDLENGKPTVEMGKVLRVLGCLGLEVRIGPRGWKSVGRPE